MQKTNMANVETSTDTHEQPQAGGDMLALAVKLAEDHKASAKPAKAPKVKAEKKEAEPLTEEGMVIYTDAGARPNPGFAGWGFHGYTYNTAVPKKGTGNQKAYLTARGYVDKHPADGEHASKPIEATPLRYIDGLGSIPPCSNNAGEVKAMAEGLRHAHLRGVKNVLVLADSKYAIDGASGHLDKWRQNNWIKSDGQPVKNLDHWKALADSLDMLKAAGVSLTINHVKAHNGNVGNTKADNYATMGVFASRAGVIRNCITTSPVEGYWGKEDSHPFLSLRFTYFISNPAANHPGEYYLGDHGKEHEVMGKRNVDVSYAYVKLNEADVMLETARSYILDNAGSTDCLAVGHIGTLFSHNFMKEVDLMDRFAFVRHGSRFNVNTVRKEPVIEELYPPKISLRAIEAVNNLKGVLTDWQNNPNTELVCTDITEKLYDIDPKKGKVLRDIFTPGDVSFKVSASYALANKEKGDMELDLALGIDMPDRNRLKRLEGLDPTVNLVTWRVVDMVRFATIIQVRDGVGIWAGYYANIKLV